MSLEAARDFISHQQECAARAVAEVPLTEKGVLAELYDNPFYYFPTVMMVEDKMTHELIPFQLKPVQVIVLRALLEDWYRGIPVRLIILKARREGVSTLIQAFFFWICATRKRRKAFTIAQDDDTSKVLHAMSETYYMNMPKPFRPDRGVSQAGRVMQFANPTKNVDEKAKRPGLDSSMRTVSLKNAGAGAGSTLLHLSEIGLWAGDNAKVALNTVLKVVPLAPHTLVARESTARGLNHFHTMWVRAKMGVSSYKPLFIPWHWEPTNRVTPGPGFTRTPEEQLLAEEHDLTDDQLMWRRIAIEDDCDGDLDNFHQEFPITDDEAFLSSGRPFFPPVAVKRELRRAQQRDPVRRGHLVETPQIKGDTNSGRGWTVFTPATRRETLRVWETNDPTDDYLISADASGGNPIGDFHAAYVFRRSTLRIVARWHGKVDRDEYGDHLYRLGKLYPGVTQPMKKASGALVAVEITGGWGAVPVSVLKWRGYPRIYHRAVSEEELSRDQSDRMGWDSTPATRPLALDALLRVIRTGELECWDEDLYQECATFAYNEKGKPEAMEGCWDDRVMAAAIGVYLWGTTPRRHAPKPQKQRRALSQATGW
jgi:hypothetical protein